jgi:uncharacterized protein
MTPSRLGSSEMTERVSATPPVLGLLERLAARYGRLVIHQSGGCCDGSSPICLPAAELPAGPHDVQLGVVGETPVYVDRDQDRRWQHPVLRIDLAAGPAMGLSLESVEGVHLVGLSSKSLHTSSSNAKGNQDEHDRRL